MRPSFGIAIITAAYGTFGGIFGGWTVAAPFYAATIMLITASICDREYWQKHFVKNGDAE